MGLNNGIIAQLEAQYAELWAQDAAAMFSYAGSSATAAKVTPFTSAPQIANPAASATQSAATAAASGNSAASIQSTLQGLFSKITTALQDLTTPAGTTKLITQASANNPLTEIWFLLTGQTILPTNLGTLINGYSPYASFFYNTEGLPYFSVGMGNFGTQIAKSAGWLGGAAPAAAGAAAKGMPGLGAGVGGAGGQVAAGLGNGAHVGAHRGSVGSGLLARRNRGAGGEADVCGAGQRTHHRRRGRDRKPGGRHARGRRGPRAWRGRRWPPIRVQTHRHGPPTPRRVTGHLTHPQGAPAAHLRPARLSASVSKLVRRERASGQLLSGRMSVSAVLAGRPSPRRTLRVGFYCGRIFIRRGGFHPAECPAGGPLIGHREPSAGGASVRFPGDGRVCETPWTAGRHLRLPTDPG